MRKLSRNHMSTALRTQLNRGVTLVEVLVTLVVISVGLLGVAALQATSLRDNHSALMRGQASALADEILDRMRANRTNALEYEVDIGDVLTGASRAALDVSEWKAQLAAVLPNATVSGSAVAADGAIEVTEVAASVSDRFEVVVTIQWGERGSDDSLEFTDAAMTFTTRTEI